MKSQDNLGRIFIVVLLALMLLLVASLFSSCSKDEDPYDFNSQSSEVVILLHDVPFTDFWDPKDTIVYVSLDKLNYHEDTKGKSNVYYSTVSRKKINRLESTMWDECSIAIRDRLKYGQYRIRVWKDERSMESPYQGNGVSSAYSKGNYFEVDQPNKFIEIFRLFSR